MKYFSFIFLFLFLITPISAVTIGESDIVGVEIELPTPITFDNATGSVNRSDFWDNLDTPADILSNGMWTRTGTQLHPTNDGDDLNVTDIYVSNGTFNEGIFVGNLGPVTALNFSIVKGNPASFVDIRGTHANLLNVRDVSGNSYLRIDTSNRATIYNDNLQDVDTLWRSVNENTMIRLDASKDCFAIDDVFDCDNDVKLQVGGNMTLKGDLLHNLSIFRTRSSANEDMLTLTQYGGAGGLGDNISIVAQSPATGEALRKVGAIRFVMNSPSNNFGALAFDVGTTGVLNEIMRLTYDGLVGIGTSKPTHELNVVGDTNITGNNFIGGDLNLTGNFSGNQYYAEGYGVDIGVIPIASAGVYYNITNFTLGQVNGATFNADGGVVAVAGLYKVDGSYSFSGTASNEYHIRVAKNDVGLLNCHAERVIGTGADVGNAGMTCFVRVDGTEHLNAQIENVDSAGDPTIHNINFNMLRIGN